MKRFLILRKGGRVRTIRLAIALAAVVSAVTPVLAQGAPVADAVDPVRLEEAKKLLDAVMPPASREQLMKSLLASMTDTMMKSLVDGPGIKDKIDARPGARDVFNRFIARQRQLANDDLLANLPSMLDAMARAYARALTLDQMREITAFFSTSAGRAYMNVAPAVLADPDVAAWQRATMDRSMQRMPAELKQLRSELDALEPERQPDAS